METRWALAIAVVLAFVGAGIYLYPILPEMAAVHWDAAGNANGFAGREWAAFGIPILMAVLLALFYVLPKIDPLDRDYKDFRKEYDGFVLAVILFAGYADAIMLAYNLGYGINTAQLLVPALGALIFYLGYILPKVKRNWFMGIRTPWTISDPKIWEQTHAFASQLFKAAGIVVLIGMLFPRSGLMVSIAVIIGVAVASVVYSYTLYAQKKGK